MKNAEIPVAGADRLVLTEHIAVMDLMALGDALLLPDDDLALASVLKSPLFGLSEEQLFDLAWDRKGSLRASLRDNPAFAATNGALDELAQAARKLSPFAFFAHVLGPMRGRAKFLARLGPEANDALDEFLNLALDYETRETPSLQGFLAWLRAAQSEVKRDMEMVRDEVRVMTVHGAKGLEADTVILADTTTPPTGPRDPRLLTLANGPLVWATARTEDVGAMSDARARSAARRARRIPAAIVRGDDARQGAAGDRRHARPQQDSRRLLVSTGRGRAEARLRHRAGRRRRRRRAALPQKRISEHRVAEEREEQFAGRDQAESLPELADYQRHSESLRRSAPSRRRARRTMTPRGRPQPAGNAKALLRGTLVHRLMQSLPDIPAERRAKAAKDYLARTGARLNAEERAQLAEQVMLVLEHPHFSELYGPGSRAEVPIVGRLILGGETVRVSGQIDRLAVTQSSVLIADFKTNRPSPRRIEDVRRHTCEQLALYRAVLKKLYPDKCVRAALIWTEVPDLMELSGEMLDAALLRITSSR